MLERRTSLNEVVAQESECASLREYGRVLIERTIFETKYQMGGYAIAMCVLRHQTIGDGLAFKGPQHKEAMHQSMALSACINEYRRESTYFSHLCEMGLPGFPLRVIMGACCIRKLRNNPAS